MWVAPLLLGLGEARAPVLGKRRFVKIGLVDAEVLFVQVLHTLLVINPLHRLPAAEVICAHARALGADLAQQHTRHQTSLSNCP